jgi:site-specific recombinase XerD
MFTSEACIKQFIDDYSLRMEKNTLKWYETSMRQLLTFCEKPYHEVTTRDVRKWLAHLVEDGYKISSIKQKMFAMRLFYKYCLDEELMTHNPVESVPIPKDEDKLPYYLTQEQLTKLRLLCEGNLRQRAVIEVFYTTGVRLRELTSMKLEDINWEERMIRIPKGKGKKERIVLFTKECAEHLNAYLQDRSDNLPFVFLNHNRNAFICPYSIQQWFVSFREKLGIYMTPHTLRHTFAAHLATRGMSMVCIQALLGHDHPKNTHIYARLNSQAQKQMYDEWM